MQNLDMSVRTAQFLWPSKNGQFSDFAKIAPLLSNVVAEPLHMGTWYLPCTILTPRTTTDKKLKPQKLMVRKIFKYEFGPKLAKAANFKGPPAQKFLAECSKFVTQ